MTGYSDTTTHNPRDLSEDPSIMQSGWVDRYHTHPVLRGRQNNAEHQWRVALIIYKCNPNPSPDLIYEAIHHDCAELLTADIAGHFKARHPEIGAVMKPLEREYRDRMGCPERELSDEDVAWLKFADLAECIGFVSMAVPHLLHTKAWRQSLETAWERGFALGIDPDTLMEVLA